MPEKKKPVGKVAEVEIDQDYLTFTDREKIFVDAYLRTFDKSKSAREAGYATSCAAAMGIAIYNRPHILGYITRKIKLLSSSTDERIRKLENIANTSMTDYFSPVERIEQTTKEIPVSQYIAGLLTSIKIEKEFIDYLEQENLFAEEPDEKPIKEANAKIRRLEQQIAKLRIEAKFFPGMTMSVPGEPKVIIDYVIDLKKIVKDKAKVQLKRVKQGKDGIELEPYSALDAHDKLIRLNGDYAKDNEQKKAETSINLGDVPDDVIKKLLDANRPD